jgi:hypothetical protein
VGTIRLKNLLIGELVNAVGTVRLKNLLIKKLVNTVQNCQIGQHLKNIRITQKK